MSLDPGTLLTLLAKGTPGPWKVCGIGDDTPESEWVTIRAQIGGALVTTTEWSADAALIAAAVNVLPEMLATIDAQREEIERSWAALGMTPDQRAQNDDPDVATLADAIAVSLQYERDVRDQQREEIARLRGSIKHAHGCLIDAGVPMPADPLDGVSEGIRALEAENAALLGRIESWTHEHGAALCPRGADTYGNGMRDAKQQVAAILRSAKPSKEGK